MNETLPAAFLATYGAPWQANAEVLADEHSVGYIADGMRRQMEALFAHELIRTKAPSLRVRVVILPFGDLRCFVWRDKSTPNEHIVAVHIGVFERFAELLSSQELWEPAMPKLKHLGRLDKRDFHRLCLYLAIYNTVSHEFAHIMRGHMGWRDAVACDTPEALDECRKLCEADADRSGSYILAGRIAMQSVSLSQTMFGSPSRAEEIAFDLLKVLSITLYRCFSLYNQTGLRHASYYPHPLLRVLNISIGVADNFSQSNTHDHIRNRLVAVLEGIELAEEFASSSGDLPQKKWDFASEVLVFEDKFSAELATLSKTLAPYSPARRSA